VEGELERYLDRVLGPCTVVGDRSWVHGRAAVIEVRDADGVTWFAKRHSGERNYRAEVAAYRKWVPALGERAPNLRAHDEELQMMVLSAVPGEDGSGLALESDAEIQRQAGWLLRRFHDAESLGSWDDFAAAKLDEFEKWAARADGLLERTQLAFARREVRRLSEVERPVRVPCHRDYGPRNWLIADGRVSVIDFEWARPEVWVNDLARLYFGPWRERPDLQDAFLDGYGRAIDDSDRAVLLGCGALSAVSTVIWAHAQGDAAFEAIGRENLRRLMKRT
jgi:Ser/Thr protein kinase RdoA (MazF antagonist)